MCSITALSFIAALSFFASLDSISFQPVAPSQYANAEYLGDDALLAVHSLQLSLGLIWIVARVFLLKNRIVFLVRLLGMFYSKYS